MAANTGGWETQQGEYRKMSAYRTIVGCWGVGAVCLLLVACSAGRSSRDVTSDLTRETLGTASVSSTRDVTSDITRDVPETPKTGRTASYDGREFTSGIHRDTDHTSAQPDSGTALAPPLPGASPKPTPTSPKTSGATVAAVSSPESGSSLDSERFLREEYGKASYYGGKFHGRPTASGEIYDQNRLTAAHPTLPFGTICRVTNLANGKQVIVRINDRGPFVKGRILDLSYRAAQILGAIGAGVIDVKVEVLRYGKK